MDNQTTCPKCGFTHVEMADRTICYRCMSDLVHANLETTESEFLRRSIQTLVKACEQALWLSDWFMDKCDIDIPDEFKDRKKAVEAVVKEFKRTKGG